MIQKVCFTKGKEHSSGKTKMNFLALEDPNVLVQVSKNAITAKDDPDLTRELLGKDVWANRTTCAVFQLFNDSGLPTAYLGQVSDNSFAAYAAHMLGFEVLVRRDIPDGSSYLKRAPHLAREDKQPHRFKNLLVEFCLKTTKGGYVAPGQQVVVEGLNAKKGEEDPIIKDPRAKTWDLRHSKKQWHLEESLLRKLDEEQVQLVLQDAVYKLGCTPQQLIDRIEKLARMGFLVLEGAFKKLGGRLQDIKFEFGLCKINGQWNLVFADVIDCDSWRLLINGQQFSKQVYRDKGDEGLAESAEKYAYIADLVQQFGIPKQALVIWRGSESDPMPDLSVLRKELPMLDIVEVIGSLHKATVSSLRKAEEIIAKYPQGGVFACLIGRSNGAGPTNAAHVEWPVLSCPVTYKDFPEDIHSNIRMPSETPNAVIWPPENIVPAVLNHLAVSNPAAYALRRYRIEELDIAA